MPPRYAECSCRTIQPSPSRWNGKRSSRSSGGASAGTIMRSPPKSSTSSRASSGSPSSASPSSFAGGAARAVRPSLAAERRRLGARFSGDVAGLPTERFSEREAPPAPPLDSAVADDCTKSSSLEESSRLIAASLSLSPPRLGRAPRRGMVTCSRRPSRWLAQSRLPYPCARQAVCAVRPPERAAQWRSSRVLQRGVWQEVTQANVGRSSRWVCATKARQSLTQFKHASEKTPRQCPHNAKTHQVVRGNGLTPGPVPREGRH